MSSRIEQTIVIGLGLLGVYQTARSRRVRNRSNSTSVTVPRLHGSIISLITAYFGYLRRVGLHYRMTWSIQTLRLTPRTAFVDRTQAVLLHFA